MLDPQDPQLQPAPAEAHNKNSPPLTPPDSDPNSDQKQSRKREREVSLEPANNPKASDADGTAGTEHRDTRTPAKRNRRALETTREESEEGTGKGNSQSRSRSHSVSPPIGVGVSPRQEIRIKVRQISQGVEDLTWKTTLKVSDKNEQVAEIIAPSTLAPSAEVDERSSAVEDAVITDAKDEDSQESAQGGLTGQTVDVDVHGDVNTAAFSGPEVPSGQTHARSYLESGEKGLKRRFGERGTSQGPNDESGAPMDTLEPLKRPRDDKDEDPNPRETKRPSPPPETSKPKSSPKPAPPSPKPAPKLTGFMAYASASPFAAVKGPSLFSSGKTTPASLFASPGPSTPLSNLGSTPGEPSSPPQKNLKRSGFEAFASPASPFTSVARSKSPVLGQTSKLGRAKSPPGRSNSVNSNPFASYIGSTQGFAIPAQKRARADSPSESTGSSLERHSTLNVLEPNRSLSPEDEEEDDRQRSFGEKLRETRDDDDDSNKSEDDPKLTLTEQEVITGEEGERTIHQVRGKLFSLDNGQWRERGTGLMKLNIRRLDGTGARLVMRKEAVYALLLNVTLFPGMLCTLAPQDPRYLRFSAIENGSTTHYNLRLGSAKAAQDLLTRIISNIPPA
ncbi:hypothetical protein P691DRAFT_656277 [Macrolepiota fuliginosa MF-IS2]|uniref:RanBD1 domain-containing protein n=1 Tax=Macrolepiota fuliginosa MF-IS2 TaxID=1400762 RepID=A0A9P5XS48_9AGAR|nr:hypothetical protein P691DRAFT_656277 [Macrolepiota fuliginosa MF-IS2]